MTAPTIRPSPGFTAELPLAVPTNVARPKGLSRKQREVLVWLGFNPEITLADAVELIGQDIYANAEKHVGALLSNMIRRGLIRRIRKGVYGPNEGEGNRVSNRAGEAK